MPKIIAVLWDLDDTLINTTDTRLRAQRHMVESILKVFPSTSLPNADAVVEKAERLARLFGSTYYVQHIPLLCHELITDPSDRQRLIEVGCRAFREAFWQIEPVEGAKQTLQGLREQGYKVGIVSNGLYPFQMQKLAQTGLEEYFDRPTIFISSHYRRQFDRPPGDDEYSEEELADPVELEFAWLKDRVEKPWPWMFGLALSAYDCTASNVIYVGDRVTDFVSARLAGIWSVRVNSHSTAEPLALLSIEEPDFSINTVTEIFTIINQIERL
jgi:FMN phosphatase YigB (HAD superfamily)